MTQDDRELAEKLLTPIFGRRKAAKEFVADNPDDVKEMLDIITAELAAKAVAEQSEISKYEPSAKIMKSAAEAAKMVEQIHDKSDYEDESSSRVMTAVHKDAPVMKAWEIYKASEDYANTKRWTVDPNHADGSLWSAFYQGYFACACHVAEWDCADNNIPEMAQSEIDKLRAENERLREALDKMLIAVCGPTGFAEAVRQHSGLSYPWEALEIAEDNARAALSTTDAREEG